MPTFGTIPAVERLRWTDLCPRPIPCLTMKQRNIADPDVPQQESEQTLERLLDEGEQRLGRSWPGLLATGFLGGLDVGIGVLALLLVEVLTHNILLAGLAFSIGLIVLTLARSELFTENFLVPVAAVVAKRGSLLSLVRLWVVTTVMNLAGGWLVTAIVIAGFPRCGPPRSTPPTPTSSWALPGGP